jgi:Ku protein
LDRTPAAATEVAEAGDQFPTSRDRLMPRAYWKGFLRLSLVSCPIEIFAATSQAEKTHFHLINTETGHRLRQQMIDEKTGEPVDTAHKGRGYEIGKGKYVPVDDDELAAVEVESTRTVDIEGFVPMAEIDKRYLDRPYYVVPSGKTGADAFAVIRDAMKDKDRVALGRIVMAHREHIVAIEPLGKGLLATTLRFDDEVRDEKSYFADIPSPRIGRDMVELAAHILDSKATRFDPRKLKDEYDTALKKLVRRKAKGHTIEPAKPAEKPDNVIDLMDALRRSIGERGGKRPRAGRAPRRGAGKTTGKARRRKTARAA